MPTNKRRKHDGLPCLACREHGQRPKYIERVPSIVFYPPIGMPGRPTIEGHRLSAEHMAGQALHFGFAQTMKDYQLTNAELLVACWWAGQYGPRRFKRAWADWSQVAGWHLWYSCENAPQPAHSERHRRTGGAA